MQTVDLIMMMEIAPDKAEQVALLARDMYAQRARAEPVLRAFISDMNVDEQAGLVALVWLGRGVFEAGEYMAACELARAEASTPSEDYLMSTPNLAFDIEAGLETLGFDVAAEAEAVMGR